MVKISPSVLTSDFLNLKDDIVKLENAGVVKREGKYICITSKELLEKFL